MLVPNTILQSRYLIVRLLAQGGMGAVYQAKDQRLGVTVALKETLFSDQVLRKAFEREARLLAGLRHPALPNVSDHFAEGDGQFLVMQFIPGDDLEDLLQHKGAPFSPIEVSIWADQLLDALDYLHTQELPIIHRDIKPQNLKLTTRDQIVLLDFGLAKGSTAEMTRAPESRSVFGYTLTYAPLEQIQGTGTDSRSDLYSLAATLYYLMIGLKPPDALTRANAVLNRQPDPLIPASQINPKVSSAIAAVLMKAMALNREQRYASAVEMRDALCNANQSLTLVHSSDFHKDAKPLDSSSTLISSEAESPTEIVISASTVTATKTGQRHQGTIDSLAVLPLDNASNDASLEYLSDGITESIINNLSQLPALRVMARSTVFHYKGKYSDPRKVGRQLNVRAVLTGRVLFLANRLIIKTELVDVADGSQLWGEQYNRELSDILAIEGEISKEISDRLRLKITGEQQRLLTRRYTENFEAYQFYLKGRYFHNKFLNRMVEVSDLNLAKELFHRSIELDENFALAHSGLGQCHLTNVLRGIGGAEYYHKAKESFNRALAIDPDLVEPRIGFVYIHLFEGRSEKARQEIVQLLRQAPNEPLVYKAAAYVYRLSGQYERTIEAWDKLMEISPTDVVIASYNRARVYIYQSDYAKAESEIAKGLTLEPQHPNLRAYSAVLDYHRGEIEKATKALENLLSSNPNLHAHKLFLAYCYLARGEPDRAFGLIDSQVMESALADQDVAYRLATVYAVAERFDEAVKWLEQAINMGNENYPWFAANPAWYALRDHPRYKSIMNSLKSKWENLPKFS